MAHFIALTLLCWEYLILISKIWRERCGTWSNYSFPYRGNTTRVVFAELGKITVFLCGLQLDNEALESYGENPIFHSSALSLRKVKVFSSEIILRNASWRHIVLKQWNKLQIDSLDTLWLFAGSNKLPCSMSKLIVVNSTAQNDQNGPFVVKWIWIQPGVNWLNDIKNQQEEYQIRKEWSSCYLPLYHWRKSCPTPLKYKALMRIFKTVAIGNLGTSKLEKNPLHLPYNALFFLQPCSFRPLLKNNIRRFKQPPSAATLLLCRYVLGPTQWSSPTWEKNSLYHYVLSVISYWGIV